MSEFKLSEEKKKLYELFLREEINFMEYINGRNDLDKEFIRLLKEEFPLESKNKPKFDALDIRFSIDKLSGDLK